MGYNLTMEVASEIQLEVLNRLKRVEGQVRGLQRLVEQGSTCRKIASQVKAARSALDAVGKLVLACYLREALEDVKGDDEGAMELIMKFADSGLLVDQATRKPKAKKPKKTSV